VVGVRLVCHVEAPCQPAMIICVDLDKTLAQADDSKPFNPEVIGEPVWRMVRYIQWRLELGDTVEIFTARVYNNPRAVALIQDWLEEVAGLPRLLVTNVKRPDQDQFLDDKSRQVIENTGVIVEAEQAVLPNHQTPRPRLLNTGLGRGHRR